MKKMRLSFLVSLFAAFLVIFASSCKKEEVIDYTPVLGTTFNFTVTGNTVVFTTTIPGNVWFTDVTDQVDYQTVDKTVTVAIAEKGTYPFTCSTLGSGTQLTSAAFDVVIAQDDPSMYAAEYWTFLTGGYGQSKGWVLDVEAKIHEGPLSFLGTSWDFVTGENVGTDAWMWDAGLSFTFEDNPDNIRMEKPGDEGYGVMYFDLINGKNFIADKKKEPAETGTYSLSWETRTLTITGGSILRSYKPFAQVKDDPNCTGDACAKHMVNGITGISDWNNYKIYALNDSVLRLAVSRDQDVHGEGVCWLIYNFISKAYDDTHEADVVVVVWPAKPTPVETNDAAVSATLTGIWKPIPTYQWAAWFAGFWNFATMTNDFPAEYANESSVNWGSYYPGEADTWAAPSDSIKACSMEFGADLSFVVKHNEDVKGTGTFKAGSSKVTCEGTVPITASTTLIDPTTCILVSVDATQLKLAFYQTNGGATQNEWVMYTYVKQ
ncbi:MAG: hypothetical protein V2A67_05545 [Bacteroidota bacterium]